MPTLGNTIQVKFLLTQLKSNSYSRQYHTIVCCLLLFKRIAGKKLYDILPCTSIKKIKHIIS